MKKITRHALWVLFALFLFEAGCSDVTNSPPPELSSGIESIIPAEGPIGARVRIGGKGFDEVQQVLFNGTVAQIESSSDTTLITRVPENATSGIVEVVTDSETLTGPAFLVDTTESAFLTIDSVEPEAGRYRDTVRIRGNGFALPPLSNTIFFGDAETSPISESDSILIATVPKNAITGLLSVVADQDTAIGPTFTVIKHTIDEVSPLSGMAGTEVVISGSNFSTELTQNKVLFNGVQAEVASGSETQLITFVPGDASSGPVSVVVREDTVQGPTFTVQTLSITGVTPQSGPTGTQVTISGTGFSDTASENIVEFNGERAELNSASQSQLIAFVPGNATTGPIEVTVDGQTATGPVFTVEVPKSLEVIISTSGTSLDTGYNLLVEGRADRQVKPNDNVTYSDLLVDQIQVELADVAGNCSVAGNNPRTVPLDMEAVSTTFNVSCSSTAPEISSINPTSGTTGTQVTISGSNFSTTTSENTITFNGTQAPVNSATTTELVTQVPAGASDGPVEVTVDGVTDTGPDFDVITSGSLEVVITTSGQDLDTDGYQLIIDSGVPSDVGNNETVTVNDLEQGTHSVELTGIASNCFISQDRSNPYDVTVAAGETTTTNIDVICEEANQPPIADFTFDCSGLTCDFDASGSSDSDGFVSVYRWSFGDGTNSVEPGPATAHTYNAAGTYSVEFTAQDNEGAEDIITKNVTVAETAPQISSISPTSGPTGTQVTISGTGFSDTASENIVEFNGERAELNSASPTQLIAFVPGNATTGPVEVTVDGQTATGPTFTVLTTGTIELNISTTGQNIDPDGYSLAFDEGGFFSVDINQVILFEDLQPGSYSIELNDIASNCFITQDRPNPYTVQVTAGDTTVTNIDVLCEDTSPSINSISPTSGPTGTEVTINGSNFSSVTSENIVTFNGERAELNGASSSQLLAVVPGNATTGPVEVTIDGQTTTGPIFTVEVPKSLEVIISTSGTSLDTGYDLLVEGRADRQVKPNDIVTYSNLLVDQIQVELSDVAGNCSVAGQNPRTVNLDNSDNAGSTQFDITCEEPNQPPNVSFGSTCTNLTCNFDAVESSDPDGIITNYDWDFGDGNTGTGETISHSFGAAGTYTVELTVTDNDEATNATTRNVTVTVPAISSISPTSGPTGTQVTISGSNFSSVASENIVTFNSERAELNSASPSQLIAFVPGNATTGLVEVTIDGYTAQGPVFTVEQSRTLEVQVQTEGTDQDLNGYTIIVSGQSNRIVKSNDTITYNDLTTDDVQVELIGFNGNCQVEGQNPRTVNLNNPSNFGSTLFIVDCARNLRGKIIFTSDRDGNQELYIQDADGTNIERIMDTRDDEVTASISPDGLKIAYIVENSGRNLYIMDSDGSDVIQVTGSGWYREPSWSPDGTQLVVSRGDNSGAQSDIFTIRVDGKNLTQLTSTAANERNPDWSPDGRRIVYDLFTDNAIQTINTDGTDLIELKRGKLFSHPEWSPDGRQIAYIQDNNDTIAKVHIMNADGSGTFEMTPFSRAEDYPSWSPDGNQMVYEVSLEGFFQIHVYSIVANSIVSEPLTVSDDRFPHWNY